MGKECQDVQTQCSSPPAAVTLVYLSIKEKIPNPETKALLAAQQSPGVEKKNKRKV